MDLFLVRHAIAVEQDAEEYPNDDRPLTDAGVRKMTEAARGIARMIPDLDVIFTSPLIRAKHTAEIVARAFGCEKRMEVTGLLAPGGWANSVIAHLAARQDEDRVMLVGHEPDMGLLAGALVGAEHSVAEFKKGSVCCIRVDGVPGETRGVIRWHLSAKWLKRMGESPD